MGSDCSTDHTECCSEICQESVSKVMDQKTWEEKQVVKGIHLPHQDELKQQAKCIDSPPNLWNCESLQSASCN